MAAKSKTGLYLAALAAAGVVYYTFRPKEASAAPTDMRDPRKLLPSKQLPKKQPVGPIVEPVPTPTPTPGLGRGLVATSEQGPMTLNIYQEADGSFSYMLENNAFFRRYAGTSSIGATDFQSAAQAKSDALRFVGESGRIMLRNDMTPTGREVAYWDYHWGVEMQHIADPLSLTGVSIHWVLYAPNDDFLADGMAESEAGAVEQLNAAMFADEAKRVSQ